MSCNRLNFPEPFRQVVEMEEPMTVILDHALTLASLAETMETDEGRMVQRLAWIIKNHADAAEKLRGELFRLTHPRREHFEHEGWPS